MPTGFDRRAFLASVALAIAGCTTSGNSSDGTPESTDKGPADDGETPQQDSDGGGNASEKPEQTGTDQETPAVSLDTPTYLVTTRNRFSSRLDSATPVDELDGAVREPVADAVRTGSRELSAAAVDDEFLAAFRQVGFVQADETVYQLSHDLPETVVTGEQVSESAVDPDRTVSMNDDVVRVLDVDNRQVVAMANTVVETEGRFGLAGIREYRTTFVDETLAEFLDETDYIAVPKDGDRRETDAYVELDVREHDPGPPYEVRADPVDPTDLFDDRLDVEPLDSLSPALQAVVRTAAERGYRTDSLPDGARDAFATPDTDDPTYYLVGTAARAPVVESSADDELPVDLSLERADTDAGVELALAVENTTDSTVRISSGAPAPFGVLAAARVHNPDAPEAQHELGDSVTLWSDAYEESDHVHVTDSGISVNDIGLFTELPAGETLSETYTLELPAPGWYEVRESIGVSVDRQDGSTLPYTVSIDATE